MDPTYGDQRPIWVHFTPFLGSSTASGLDATGESANISAVIPGVSPTQRDYVLDSVVLRIKDADDGGLSGLILWLAFYGNSTYGDITLANDLERGHLRFIFGLDAFEFTDTLWTAADHEVGMSYTDYDSTTDVRKVYAQILLTNAATINTADTWALSVALVPV